MDHFIKQGSAEYWRAIIALFFAGFVTFSVLYMFQPLLPNLADEFHISPATASLALSFATLALAVTLPFSGSLSDSFGRRGMMRIALPGAAFLALITACSLPFSVLLGVRFLQGLILAGVPAIAMAYLHDEIEKKAIGAAMGLYIAGNAIGGMSGRIVTMVLTDFFSWRIAVFSLGMICLLMSFLFCLLLPPSRNFVRQKPQPLVLIRSLIGHLCNGNLLMIYCIGFTIMGCFVTLYNYVTFQLLGAPFNLPQSLVALVFLSYIFGSISSSVTGKLADRFGRHILLFACLFCMFVGVLLTLPAHLPLVILGIVLMTSGFFGAHSVASSWVGGIAGKGKGQASSLYLLFYYLGSSVSGTVGGLLYSHGGWDAVVILLCVLIGLAASFGIHLHKNEKLMAKQQEPCSVAVPLK